MTFNEKTQTRDGNFLRKEKKDVQTQPTLIHKQFDEFSRVRTQIKT